MCRPRCGPWWFCVVDACVKSEVAEVPPAFVSTFFASSNMKWALASDGWFGMDGYARLPLYRESFERVEVTEAVVAPPPPESSVSARSPRCRRVPSHSSGCSASDTFAFRPRAATAASKPRFSSVGYRYALLITFMRFSRPTTDGITSASKRKLASMIGSSASPRDLSVPSRSCSARSRIALSSSVPSGMRFSRASRSDSWLASFTSSGLVLAGGRDISSPNRHTRNARCTVQRKAHLDSVEEASTLSWCEIGLMLCFLPFFFGGGGRSIIRLGGFASISEASRTPSVHASRPCPCACRPSARANSMSHASSDGLMLENICCCCFDSPVLQPFCCGWVVVLVVVLVVAVPLAAADAIDGSGSPDGPGSAALVDASSTVPSLEPCRLALLCLLLLLLLVVAVVTSAGAFTDPSGSCVCCSSTIFSTSYSLMLPEIS
uniref:Uncharacterized protein n=1 Tax=Anopheles merus TaxID=30066 RepID=A0A182VK46_ANOME